MSNQTEKKNNSQNNLKKYLKTVIKFILIAVILYFIYQKIKSNWDEIICYEWSINVWYLILSIISHIITFIIFSKVWCYIISGFNYQVPLIYGFKLAYIGSLGRYLPGKVWTIFGMAYLAKKIGIKEEESIASWIMVIVFTLPPAFLIGFVVIALYPELISEQLSNQLGISIYIMPLITIVLSGVLILAPDKSLAIFNKLLKIIKRPPIKFKVDTIIALKIYIGYLISWLFFGISFWLFINAIVENPDIPVVATVGAYVFAYQIGFIAIFTPGGIGVREFALWSMLEPSLGSVAVGIAVAARLWNIAVELLSAIAALLIKFPKNRN